MKKDVIITILIGTALLLLVIHLEHLYAPHHPAATFMGSAWAYALKFGEHLGIAVLSIGAIGFLLELPHWQRIFHKHIVDTITEEAYLKKFGPTELDEIQTKLMKAFFKTEDVEKADSFFRYYREKIQDFIGKPYREETSGITKIKYHPTDQNAFIVEETISFVCRRLGEDIQKEAKWTTELDEIASITSFRITVTVPPAIGSQAVTPRVFDQSDPELKKVAGKWGYCLSLEDYKGVNGLKVMVEVTYVVSRDRAFSWTMPYISKGMTCTIIFPTDLKIFTDQFVMEDIDNPCAIKSGECVFRYPYWLLPGDGLAFHFRKL